MNDMRIRTTGLITSQCQAVDQCADLDLTALVDMRKVPCSPHGAFMTAGVPQVFGIAGSIEDTAETFAKLVFDLVFELLLFLFKTGVCLLFGLLPFRVKTRLSLGA